MGESFFHFGIDHHLHKYLSQISEHGEIFYELAFDPKVFVRINVDGIPIHHSTKFQFWPIMIQFYINSNTLNEKMMSNIYIVTAIRQYPFVEIKSIEFPVFYFPQCRFLT